MLLRYCATVLLCYCATVLLCYCATVLLCYCATPRWRTAALLCGYESRACCGVYHCCQVPATGCTTLTTHCHLPCRSRWRPARRVGSGSVAPPCWCPSCGSRASCGGASPRRPTGAGPQRTGRSSRCRWVQTGTRARGAISQASSAEHGQPPLASGKVLQLAMWPRSQAPALHHKHRQQRWEIHSDLPPNPAHHTYACITGKHQAAPRPAC